MRVDIDSGDCGTHEINDSIEQPDTHEVEVTQAKVIGVDDEGTLVEQDHTI